MRCATHAGCGPNLLAYSLRDSRLLLCYTIFDEHRVHGISTLPILPGKPHKELLMQLPKAGAEEAGGCLLVTAHSGRHIALLLVASVRGGRLHAQKLACSGVLNAWILTAAIVHTSTSSCSSLVDGGSTGIVVVVGKADNSLDLLQLRSSCRPGSGKQVWSLTRRLTVESTSRLLLYSMSIKLLIPGGNAAGTAHAMNACAKGGAAPGVEVWVSSGTIFNEVLVWRALTLPAPDQGLAQQMEAQMHRMTALEARLAAAEARLAGVMTQAQAAQTWQQAVWQQQEQLKDIAHERWLCYADGDGDADGALVGIGGHLSQEHQLLGASSVVQAQPLFCLKVDQYISVCMYCLKITIVCTYCLERQYSICVPHWPHM